MSLTRGDRIAAWSLAATVIIGVGAWFFPQHEENSQHANDQVGNSSEVTADPVSGSNRSPNVITREGVITLNKGYSAVLDTRAADWGVEHGCGNCSLWLAGALVGGYGGDLAMLEPGATASYATCASVTQYEHRIEFGDIAADVRFCVRTPNNNYAVAQVTDFQDSKNGFDDQITVAVTAWF